MNAFTSYTGSGPAFIYYFVEAFIDSGLMNGIPVNVSREMAIDLLYGAAQFLKTKNVSPNEVKYIVTTPNGTTIAGLYEFDKYRLRHAVNQAITRGKIRSEELEKENLKDLSKF
jgi:pyrroline-5-carboxylate reductase